MNSMLNRVSASVLDFLFPMQCCGCGREGKILCQGCISSLAPLKKPHCALCASPNTQSPCRWCLESPLEIDGIRSPFLYDGAIKLAVQSFKYRGIKAAAPELGQLLASYLDEHPLPGELIVPVPLHPRRIRRRGYNQSLLLARELAKLTGLDLDEKLLLRVKDAPPQVGASRSQRRGNVEGNFRCQRDVSGKALILVDDVATTGSTLSAYAAALKAAGADTVWGLVLAREA